ncbi:hypothetical protein E4U24_001829 [Claviceps purpurea]|nr:hypothetical protein E4U24_001829 [Claviceps purpurea]
MFPGADGPVIASDRSTGKWGRGRRGDEIVVDPRLASESQLKASGYLGRETYLYDAVIELAALLFGTLSQHGAFPRSAIWSRELPVIALTAQFAIDQIYKIQQSRNFTNTLANTLTNTLTNLP